MKEEVVDEKIARARAEMLAAMDCLMHHLSDQDDYAQWSMNALKDGLDWHVLDEENAHMRFVQYHAAVGKIGWHQFDCILHTFASIVKGQCFKSVFNRDAFSLAPVKTEHV